MKNGEQMAAMKRLDEYRPFFGKVFKRIVGEYAFSAVQPLENVYESEQRVVTVLNHSTPLSWLPAICLLTEKICEGGGEARVPVGVMDKFFFQNPLFKPVAERLTQFNCFPSFEDIIKKANDFTDVAIFPEGSNCFFGRGEIIQPFRSPRFIELALKMKAKIFIVVHRGSEDWAHSVRVQGRDLPFQAYLPGWLNEKIQQGGFFVIPKIPKKIRQFRMTCDFYEPSITIDELSRHRGTKMKQLWSEAELVRIRMQEMFDSMAS